MNLSKASGVIYTAYADRMDKPPLDSTISCTVICTLQHWLTSGSVELPSTYLSYVLTMSSPVMTSSNQPHVSDQSSVGHGTPAGSPLITTTLNPVTLRSTSPINAALCGSFCVHMCFHMGAWLSLHNWAICAVFFAKRESHIYIFRVFSSFCSVC